MKVIDTIEALINLPNKFNSTGNMSIYDLLKETGYLEMNEELSIEQIRNGLAQSSKCVEDWIIYSEDKRSSSGWYFRQKDKQLYVVGFIGTDGKNTYTEYGNRLEACANFIKHEVDDIGGLSKAVS